MNAGIGVCNSSLYKMFSPVNFQNHTSHNPDIQESSRNTFLNMVDRILMDLVVASGMEDLQTLRSIIYNIKGSVGIFCTEYLKTQMEELARLGHELHRKTYLMFVNRFITDLNTLLNEVKSFQILAINSQTETTATAVLKY